jgi:hypothetical protein
MLVCFYPKHLSVAAVLLMAASLRGWAAEAAAPAPALATTGDEISVTSFNFNPPLIDPYAKASWLVAEVDFMGKASSGKWLDDVDVTLTLGWGSSGAKPTIDLALASSIRLLSFQSGAREVVFFLVPPEVLARGVKGQALVANAAPTFYAVQFKEGGLALTDDYKKSDVSAQTLPNKDYVDAFVAKGERNGKLMSEASVPSYVLYSLLVSSRVGSNVFPTFVQNSTTGH